MDSYAYKVAENEEIVQTLQTENIINSLLFMFSFLPVGICPDTLAEKRNRSPRNTGKSVSMFSNVAVWESVTVFPRKSFSCECSPSSPPSSVFFISLFSGLLLLLFLLVWIQKLHSLSGFSLFASYGLSRTLHFVSRGVRKREGERASAAEKVRDVTKQELIGKKHTK